VSTQKGGARQTTMMVRLGRGFRVGALGLLHRLNLDRLITSHSERVVVSLYALVCGGISIGVMSLAAWLSKSAFIFASLGPSAFLFFYAPRSFAAAPRSALIGHFVGAAVGYASLYIFFGTSEIEPILHVQMKWHYIFTAAFSLGFTSAIMVFLDSPHPPAGSTTLLVALGFMSTLEKIAYLMLAVVMLTGISILFNRLAGIRYSIWPGKRERMTRE